MEPVCRYEVIVPAAVVDRSRHVEVVPDDPGSGGREAPDTGAR
jgi:hypothetical protein